MSNKNKNYNHVILELETLDFIMDERDVDFIHRIKDHLEEGIVLSTSDTERLDELIDLYCIE